MQSLPENIGRRSSVPVIYTRGTNYEVGFDVGRTFSGMIQSFLSLSGPLNKSFLPLYETPAGKKVYDETLASVTENFPQYVRELQGTADGAKVPFHKLFLLHMDRIICSCNAAGGDDGTGCTTVCCNEMNQEILGHTEDALSEVMNHIYFVSAHIVSDTPQGRWQVKEERFTSLCYAGHLPGFTMSYNHHGMVYSINTVSAATLVPGKTPRFFLTRALLSAENLAQAQLILRDAGCGAADGVSVNMTFLRQDGDRLFHNAEVSPAADGADQSQLSILTASPGEPIYHCNKYLRLKIPEETDGSFTSSVHRQKTIEELKTPKTKEDVVHILGDESDQEYPIFRSSEHCQTVAVGIFDCIERTWSIYTDNPKTNKPIVILPIQLKSTTKQPET